MQNNNNNVSKRKQWSIARRVFYRLYIRQYKFLRNTVAFDRRKNPEAR